MLCVQRATPTREQLPEDVLVPGHGGGMWISLAMLTQLRGVRHPEDCHVCLSLQLMQGSMVNTRAGMLAKRGVHTR